MTAPSFNLRYAAHLGYLAPEPLFYASVGNMDVRAHVEFAAALGLGGIFHPWAIARPAAENKRFRQALADFGLQCGGLVFAPMEALLAPTWVQAGNEARRILGGYLDQSVDLARELGASTLVALLRDDRGLDPDTKWRAAVDHLRWAAERVAGANLCIAIEPMVALPDMLLPQFGDSIRLLEEVAHPAAKLVFDTGHVHEMTGDVLSSWREARHHVGPIQLADMPGRTEPGSGALDFAAFLSQVVRDGRGAELLELEFSWVDATVAGERAGVERLRRIDARIRA
ncbi:MAG TPA: sugar phosphate isomerase/epimerase family protein [Steroidobacteraceae bacterium]|nr:sugar phosphate isomerase/epimerase family protein [Steroidobacteraceae bacterium]